MVKTPISAQTPAPDSLLGEPGALYLGQAVRPRPPWEVLTSGRAPERAETRFAHGSHLLVVGEPRIAFSSLVVPQTLISLQRGERCIGLGFGVPEVRARLEMAGRLGTPAQLWLCPETHPSFIDEVRSRWPAVQIVDIVPGDEDQGSEDQDGKDAATWAQAGLTEYLLPEEESVETYAETLVLIARQLDRQLEHVGAQSTVPGLTVLHLPVSTDLLQGSGLMALSATLQARRVQMVVLLGSTQGPGVFPEAAAYLQAWQGNCFEAVTYLLSELDAGVLEWLNHAGYLPLTEASNLPPYRNDPPRVDLPALRAAVASLGGQPALIHTKGELPHILQTPLLYQSHLTLPVGERPVVQALHQVFLSVVLNSFA